MVLFHVIFLVHRLKKITVPSEKKTKKNNELWYVLDVLQLQKPNYCFGISARLHMQDTSDQERER